MSATTKEDTTGAPDIQLVESPLETIIVQEEDPIATTAAVATSTARITCATDSSSNATPSLSRTTIAAVPPPTQRPISTTANSNKCIECHASLLPDESINVRSPEGVRCWTCARLIRDRSGDDSNAVMEGELVARGEDASDGHNDNANENDYIKKEKGEEEDSKVAIDEFTTRKRKSTASPIERDTTQEPETETASSKTMEHPIKRLRNKSIKMEETNADNNLTTVRTKCTSGAQDENDDANSPTKQGATKDSSIEANENVIDRLDSNSKNKPISSTSINNSHASISLDDHIQKSDNKPPSKQKKERLEFTAAQKIQILSELTTPTKEHRPSIKQLIAKYQVSKSSLFRWKQPQFQKRLHEMIHQDGKGERKRDIKDPLLKVKEGLEKFVHENRALPMEEQILVTAAVIQARGTMIRNELLERHENNKGEEMMMEEDCCGLSEGEVVGLKAFRVTKSWAGRIGNKMGWFTPQRAGTRVSKKVNGGGDDNLRNEKCNDDIVAGDFQQQEQQQQHQVGNGEHGEAGVPIIPPFAPQLEQQQQHNTSQQHLQQQQEEKQAIEKAKQNTIKFLSNALPNNEFAPKPKKERKEFTCQEKIAILEEIANRTDSSLRLDQLCKKYNTSKSSFFRWKAQYKKNQLQDMVSTCSNDGGGYKRLKLTDHFSKVKSHLKSFIEDNNNHTHPSEKRVAISTLVLQQEAQRCRDELLAHYEKNNAFLSEEEVAALSTFKVSKGWVRKLVNKWGLKEDGNPLLDVAVSVPAVSPGDGIMMMDGGAVFESGDGQDIHGQNNVMNEANHHQVVETMMQEEQHPQMMNDYVKEMAEEAVDATMKMVTEMDVEPVVVVGNHEVKHDATHAV